MNNALLCLLVGLGIMFALLFYLYYRLTVKCEELEHELLVVHAHIDEVVKYMSDLKVSHELLMMRTRDEFDEIWRVTNGYN